MKFVVTLLCAGAAYGAVLPAGTELSIRLLDKIASEAPAASPVTVRAAVIAPVVVDGRIVLPAGPQLTGAVKDASAASGATRAQLRLDFTEISMGSLRAKVSAIVSGLENARETVDDKGMILGIDASQSYGGRLDEGIAKLQGSDRFAGLASLIMGAKEALKIQDVDANIDYDPGAEMTLKLTAPLDWRGPSSGPEARLQPFPDQDALVRLVDGQPFRTVAVQPPRPSDMTNIMLIGTEEELRAAFDKAGWVEAARLDMQSKIATARALIEDRGYKEGPMSVLLLDGQPPAFALQKGNNTFSQRHHMRVFRRPGTFAGKPVWVCSSTHDIGIDFSDRDHTFIHKVDSSIDRERSKIVNDLLFTGMVKSLALVDRPNVPQSISNATGDTLKTDGRMAVLMF
ncbi:MAG: LssY C-terminal domain-containing protein [Acidobacteriota bacterium]|nr:LssY C-terminal domain-containing protein [Acidobacteriota bacterium]